MIPITNIATIIFEFESFAPFWNSSQTNEPKPGLWASNSIAINTIQATESVILNPVKIKGNDDGKITLNTFWIGPSFNTLATFKMSLSTVETPITVFTNVAHIEHNPTLINEIINELSVSESLVKVFTIIKTNNNQTTGETGLKIWINQLIELRKVSLKPITTPMGTAIKIANRNPANTVLILVIIWSTNEGLPV